MTQLDTSTRRILSVDDETEISELIADYLGGQGFDVVTAESGAAAFEILESQEIDLVLLDLMMPGEDGLSVCRRIRARQEFQNLPIIMVTAMGEDVDRIIGLEVGADDYMAKPFNPRELSARIKAVLRRTARPEPVVQADTSQGAQVFEFSDWALNLDCAQLTDPNGQDVELTAGEFNLLRVLVEAAPRVLSRDHLLDVTVGREAMPFDRAIDIQISRLRSKLEPNPKAPIFIKTVRGQGYAFSQVVTKQNTGG